MSGQHLFRLRTGLAALAAAGLAANAAPTGEPAATLRHNPFQRPAQALTAPAAQDAPVSRVVEAAPPRLELKALLLAGPDTVVNINGQLLSIGDRIEGYRIAGVKGTRVTLIKDGQRLVLDTED